MRTKIFIMTALLAAVGTLFGSCSKDSDSNDTSITQYLYGTWQSRLPDITVTLNKNNTCTVDFYDGHFQGTYTVQEYNGWDVGRWADITMYQDGTKMCVMKVMSYDNDHQGGDVNIESDKSEWNINDVHFSRK